jgi:hypothetical protein
MYVDTQNTFSDAQAVTATAISTNVIDLVSLGIGAGTNIGPNTVLDIGNGEPIYLVVSTAVAVTDAGSDATLVITLESSASSALGSPTVHFTSATLPFASFATAGTQFVAVALPMDNYSRYLGVRYTVAAGPLTAGAFDAFLTTDVQRTRAYKSGFTVQ